MYKKFFYSSIYISKIRTMTGLRSSLPLYAIATSATTNFLLALTTIGSTTAWNACTSLTVAGFFSTYLVTASVMLRTRLTVPSDQILRGHFRLGRAGISVTVISIIFTGLGLISCFMPPVAAWDLTTFNWSFVVYISIVLVASGWWVMSARHVYTGPKVDKNLYATRR